MCLPPDTWFNSISGIWGLVVWGQPTRGGHLSEDKMVCFKAIFKHVECASVTLANQQQHDLLTVARVCPQLGPAFFEETYSVDWSIPFGGRHIRSEDALQSALIESIQRRQSLLSCRTNDLAQLNLGGTDVCWRNFRSSTHLNVSSSIISTSSLCRSRGAEAAMVGMMTCRVVGRWGRKEPSISWFADYNFIIDTLFIHDSDFAFLIHCGGEKRNVSPARKVS